MKENFIRSRIPITEAMFPNEEALEDEEQEDQQDADN